MTRILLLGANGQLGRALQPELGELGELITAARGGRDVGADLAVDLADRPDFDRLIGASGATLVVNAAAFTAVDGAESDPDTAFRVNGEAVTALSSACAAQDVPLVHYSTDFVFDGSGEGALTETAPTAPLSVYGRSKLAGEEGMRGSGVRGLLLRTSWVYGASGANFFLTMLRLGRERSELRVVADQFGVPNWTRALASRTVAALNIHLEARLPWPTTTALYHLSASGRTSWHGFAEAILAEVRRQLPEDHPVRLQVAQVTAITTADYPTPARRPANSELDATAFHTRYGIPVTDWREELAACVREWLGRAG